MCIRDSLETVSKDPAVYPAYDDALRPLWKEETQRFLEYVVFDAEGSVADMLGAPYTMMNAELAAFYGVSGGPSGEAFERVELDPATVSYTHLTLPTSDLV